jgi:hypothetical protein
MLVQKEALDIDLTKILMRCLKKRTTPPSFRLETLFSPREVPGFKTKLPFDQSSAEYWYFSYLNPVTVEKARVVAKSLTEEQKPCKNKKQKTGKVTKKLDWEVDFPTGAEQRIRCDWLLDKKNVYALPSPKLWKWQMRNFSHLPVSTSASTWTKLPDVMQKQIVQHVDNIKTLCRLAQVNKQLNNLTTDEELWKKFRKDVGIVVFVC